MKKLSFLMLSLIVCSSVSFAQDTTPEEKNTPPQGPCMDMRTAAHDEIVPLRDEIRQSWDIFREEYGSTAQYFEDLSDEDKAAIKAMRADTREAIQDKKKEAKRDFKMSFDTGIIDEVAGIIIDLRTIAFDELRNYVTIDAEGYDDWVEGYLAVIDQNESLRSQIAQVQVGWRTDCYDERSQKMYDKALTLIERITDAWDSEKMLEKLPNFIERIDTMIETTINSSVPDEQKESRLELLYILQDALQTILDDLQS